MSLFRRVAIVGVGLIGGSIGLGLTRRGLAQTVVGIGRRMETLEAAKKAGAIHEASLELADGVTGADLVLVATPVGRIAADVLAAAGHLTGALISDAGSTKAGIVSDVERRLCPAGKWQGNVRFVGGHPIAGSEKKGIAHARDDLFEGRLCILTPTAKTSVADVEQLSQLWGELGSKVLTMQPDAHDRALAAISHAPHVVATAASRRHAGSRCFAGRRWLAGHDANRGRRCFVVAADSAGQSGARAGGAGAN